MNADDLCGTVLGTCTLQKVIGRGGMGAVYLAQQSRPRRQVAVKVLFPITTLQPHQQKAFLERFRRETDAAASLEHPNITPVHEYGERDGLAYLVMAYIGGGTLRDELESQGKLPLTRIVSYLEQMAAALDFAHERKVVHRDIKPANILMTLEKRLLLTDFGLVKIMIDGQDQSPLSEVGMPMGTPDYMAPEQVIGAEVDARADIYSLGVLLYHMVTGAPPFQGATPMKVALQHVHMPPPLPRLSRPDLPPAAEQVILRALTKRPADRYSSARDLATTFRLALEAAGVQVDISGLGNEERGLGNRRRGLFDPVWRSSMPYVPQLPAKILHTEQKNVQNIQGSRLENNPSAHASKEELPRRDIIAQTSMTIPSFSGIITEENMSHLRQGNGLLYGSDMMPQIQQDNAIIGLAPDIPQESPTPIDTHQVHTPLPPVYEASFEQQINPLSRQANPYDDREIMAKPAHRLLFSPAHLRPGHKTHWQNFQTNQLKQQGNRQTDKGPAISAQPMHIAGVAQSAEQVADATPTDARPVPTKQNNLAVDRFARLSARGTLLHPTGRYRDVPTPEHSQPLTIGIRKPATDKPEESKTEIASVHSQRITTTLYKSWLALFQQELWQGQIKNNKRKVLMIGLVFLIICAVIAFLIIHGETTTGLRQHDTRLAWSASTRVMLTSSITLADPLTCRACYWVDSTDKAWKIEISSIGTNGQLGGS